MSIPVTLNNVANLQDTTTAATTINNNNSTLTTALADGLSRSGQTPNTMSASIDMSSNHILNLPAPGGPLEPVRLTDVAAGINVVSGPVSYGSAPAAGVGLTAVTGVALTVAHSDSIPKLDQTIAPNWTGQHTFNTAGGTVTGVIISGATAGALTIKTQGSAGGVITFPNATDTLVTKTTTDTLTNKTLTSPAITGGTFTGGTYTSLVLAGTNTGTYTLAGTPTILSPTISGGALTAITMTGSMTGGNITNTIVGTSGSSTTVGLFGALSGTTVTGSTSVLSSGTGGVGYSTGAGNTVTQGSSRTTAVTLNALSGTITLVAGTQSSGTVNTFSWGNNTIANTDVVITNITSATTTFGHYLVNVHQSTSGGVKISVRNVNTNAQWTSESPIIYFTVIKGVTS